MPKKSLEERVTDLEELTAQLAAKLQTIDWDADHIGAESKGKREEIKSD